MPPKGLALVPEEADGHAEGDKKRRVENQSHHPEGAELLVVHVVVWLCPFGR